MSLRRIRKLFESGNVMISGVKGSGKDMLMGNIIVRRKLPYVSNVNYGGKYIPLDFNDIDCGGNTYRNFIEGTVKRYVCPYPEKADVYISDAGIYLPAQFCKELNKEYPYLATYAALSRQINSSSLHTNCQAAERVYDKLREQSENYLRCNKCFVILGFVIQIVTSYDQYDAFVKRVPPFKLTRSLLSGERKYDYEKELLHYEISYGKIRRYFLFYRNKSTYDTRRFKELLENGID